MPVGCDGYGRIFFGGISLMSRTKPIARHIVLVTIISLATYARLQHASAETGVVNDNRQRFSIAVPDFSDSSTSNGASWSAMAQANLPAR
jgi:hypothetical protein